MPKYLKSKKGKQPFRQRRGLNGRRIPLQPDPEPPDDQVADHGVQPDDSINGAPVTAGDPVIREPSPSPPYAVPSDKLSIGRSFGKLLVVTVGNRRNERERERDLYFSVVTGTHYGTKTPPDQQPAMLCAGV